MASVAELDKLFGSLIAVPMVLAAPAQPSQVEMQLASTQQARQQVEEIGTTKIKRRQPSVKDLDQMFASLGAVKPEEETWRTKEGIEYSPYDLPISEARRLRDEPKVLIKPGPKPEILQPTRESLQPRLLHEQREELKGLDILLPEGIKPKAVEPAQKDETFINFLKKQEGSIGVQKKLGYYKNDRFNVYDDTAGNPTVGYGHNLNADSEYLKTGKVRIGGVLVDPKSGLTNEQADELLRQDIVDRRKQAASVFGKNWDKLPEEAKNAATELVFNLGIGGFRKYKKFQKALIEGDWEAAAKEAHRRGIGKYRNEAIRELLPKKRMIS